VYTGRELFSSCCYSLEFITIKLDGEGLTTDKQDLYYCDVLSPTMAITGLRMSTDKNSVVTERKYVTVLLRAATVYTVHYISHLDWFFWPPPLRPLQSIMNKLCTQTYHVVGQCWLTCSSRALTQIIMKKAGPIKWPGLPLITNRIPIRLRRGKRDKPRGSRPGSGCLPLDARMQNEGNRGGSRGATRRRNVTPGAKRLPSSGPYSQGGG